MTVTITITDPTADESRAVRAYLTALHGGTATAPVGPMDPPYIVGEKSIEQEPGNEGVTVTVPPASDDEPITSAEGPDFDSAGMPWDERIHASSRATVADGTWRKKRGVSPEEVERVEQELRALTQYDPTEEELKDAAAARGEPYPEVPMAAPDAPSPKFTPEEELPQAAQDAKVLTVDAPPPPPAAAPNPFLAVMSRIGKSKLDKAKKDELLTAAGALDDKGNPSILVLNKRPELIDGFVALLDSEGV